MQYTLRNIPKSVDRLLRERATADRKSLNEVVIETLARGLGLNGESTQYNDLDWFFGKRSIEPKVIKAIQEQDVVHPDDWK